MRSTREAGSFLAEEETGGGDMTGIDKIGGWWAA